MDKAISIGSAILIALCFLFMAWFLSGGIGYDALPRSLERGLAMLGGPLGFWGGVALVAAVGGAVYGLHELMNTWAGRAYVRVLRGRGDSDEAIAAKVDALPVSRGLKHRMMKAAKKSA